MTNAIIVFTTAMLAAIGSLLLAIFNVVEFPVAILAGAAVFLAITQMHAAILRKGEKRRTRSEIARLKQANKEIRVALQETHGKIEQVKSSVEAKATAQSKKIVAELQVLESLMRDFAGKVASSARAVAPAEHMIERRAPVSAKNYMESLAGPELLETIRAALEENRVDLYLQPIVSLPQRKLRYYEALSRLRAEDGTVIMPAQYMKVAAPAGLMSVVDNLLLFRCVQIVRRLTTKTKEIAVFCNISGDTLADQEFFPQFLEYMHHNRDLANQIVFEFSQTAVLRAGQQGDSNLMYLSNLGFALSMDHVDSLALDFAKLKGLGFRHIKVRAQTLTGGMQGANAQVAAEDFKKLLSRHGLNLIAERVEDEKTVVQLLDYNVDFAQGYLFGEPRAVRDDQVRVPEFVAPERPASIVPFKRSA
ncbi:MAG TPA: EAL domain-containing protein [Rhizomicrobium sp.]|jgi:cyclic-di-GMP phosphodiesterase TipF (flagellum assembly factor)